jgi:hypothetical protein
MKAMTQIPQTMDNSFMDKIAELGKNSNFHVFGLNVNTRPVINTTLKDIFLIIRESTNINVISMDVI